MSNLPWFLAAAFGLLTAFAFLRAAGRSSRTRAFVLEEARRMLRGGVIETLARRGPQARGRLGELEMTVDLFRDSSRPSQSPMWRVLAVGPVRLDRPIEARVSGWQGWIDPWLQLGETLVVPSQVGPDFTVHSEHPVTIDHPLITALRHQGSALADGALHARTDLMRAEVRFHVRPEANHPLFSYLRAMREISEAPIARRVREALHGTSGARRPGALIEKR